MHQFRLEQTDKLTKVEQIVHSISNDIEKGTLKKNARLPSINEFSGKYNVARDTIEKAYKELKKAGYVISVAAKGYYVKGKKDQRLRILLIFNKLSSYKKNVFEAFIEALGDKAKVDLQMHHYDPRILKEIIENNMGKYHYYVVMPHFYHDANRNAYLKVLKSIPEDELLLLDKCLPELGNRMAVFQDFKEDIYNALLSSKGMLKKYKQLTIICHALSNHPLETFEGARQFCSEAGITYNTIDNAENERLISGTVYIVTSESDLAQLIKMVRESEFELGKEIGIISFNETVLKELLDITVITTDFEEMGRSAADLILKRNYTQVKNPFNIIRRSSV
jgi:DNA-binding transcriptional regulator YhcF (GntR family)